MKTKGVRKNKINIVTLGCSKNLVDSENILTQLRGNGMVATHEDNSLDNNIVIINTCGFIDNAKQESVDTILRYADAKEKGEIDKLYVTGCLSHRYKDDLEKEIPTVDRYFGTNELPALLKTLKADYKKELVGERLITTPRHFAYFKISEGCNRPCSFCAIPLMRGRHVSAPMEELVIQAQHLVNKGTKELVLIAQDLTDYGIDLYKKRTLPDLLKRLSDIDGLSWIRLQYAFPSQFPLEVLDVIRERSNICKYLDMPLQHISSKILKLMRRGITKERTIELIDIIRERVPGIALRTTMIAGHPGETENDFLELSDFVSQVRFDRLGIFTYSHEENTFAHTMNDNVPDSEKQNRANLIMATQEKISWELNQEKIGKKFKVLFDRVEGGNLIGRTEFDSPEVDNEVLVPSSGTKIQPGNFGDVLINDASEFDLFGEVQS